MLRIPLHPAEAPRYSALYDPITMTVVSAGVGLVGTVLTAGGQMAAGRQQADAEKYQAALAKQNATQIEATSQRQAIEERRKASFAVSRARALAAASGGGATDPTVMNIEAGLAGQGEYNALSKLYSGTAEANQQRDQASIYKSMAGQAQSAGMMRGIGTIIGGISDAGSMFMKYGGGPSAPSPASYG